MTIAVQSIPRQERDKLLDELKDEVKQWTQKERQRVQEQADFCRRILQARAGSGRLLTSNLEFASKITAQNINQLLGVKVAQEKKE